MRQRIKNLKEKNMFFRKKEKKEKKVMDNVDKLVMGALIGGAIGSVIGAKYAAKKKDPKKKSLFSRIIQKFHGKKEKEITIQENGEQQL
jgi:hypothetical protein